VSVRRADTWRTRLRGLAWRRTTDHALYFPRCRSVHTIGMRFALDLIWVDAAGDTVRVDRDVAPLRARSCRAAHGVIECPAGSADALLATLGRAWLS
jgi:uncharacterized membrane protein (UPF0127 family)